jgi:hypothetical protein
MRMGPHTFIENRPTTSGLDHINAYQLKRSQCACRESRKEPRFCTIECESGRAFATILYHPLACVEFLGGSVTCCSFSPVPPALRRVPAPCSAR